MRFVYRIIAFMGNFSPLFLVVYVIYFDFQVNLYLFPVSLTFLCNLIWLHILGKRNVTDSHIQDFEVRSANDMGHQVTGYFLSYALSLPAVAIVGGLKGAVILAILLTLVFVLSHGSRIMLFNPFLSVFGYRIFEVELTSGSRAFFLSRDKMISAEQTMTAAEIEDYVYVVISTRRHLASAANSL
jgi:hypothetical protein